jgi:site-specific recombinase XerD
VLTVYFVARGASLDDMKKVYREQEEERHPGKVIPYLDERYSPVDVVYQKHTAFKTLLSTAGKRCRIVVQGLRAMEIDYADFVKIFEKRRADREELYVRLLDENFLLDPRERDTTAFLKALMQGQAQAMKGRARLPASLAEIKGDEVVEDIKAERRRGTVLRDIAAKFGISVASAYNYTKGIPPPPRNMSKAPKEVKAREELLQKLSWNPPKPGSKQTPEEKLREMIARFVHAQRKSTTGALYQVHLQTYMAFFEKLTGEACNSLDKFAVEPVIRFKIAREEDGKRPATIAAELRTIKAFVRFCVDEGVMQKSPIARIKLPQVEKSLQTEPLTQDEVTRILKAAHDMLAEAPAFNPAARWKAYRDFVAVYLLAGVGMRHSGLLTLRKCDYARSGAGPTLAIQSKTNAGRYSVTISNAVADVIEPYIDTYFHDDPPDTYLFHPSPQVKNRHMSLSASNLRINAIFDRAGILQAKNGRTRRAHSFRVSWAKLAYEHGADIKTIQNKMNHKSIQQTYAYLKIDDKIIETDWLPKMKMPYVSAEARL